MLMIRRSPSSNPPGNSEYIYQVDEREMQWYMRKPSPHNHSAYDLHQYYDHCVKIYNDQTTMGLHRLTPPASNKYIHIPG